MKADQLEVTGTIAARGIVVGGGQAMADFAPSKLKADTLVYDAVAKPFKCLPWGEASCEDPDKGTGELTCPTFSERHLTGAFLDNSISRLRDHPTFFVLWYLCVRQAPQQAPEGSEVP